MILHVGIPDIRTSQGVAEPVPSFVFRSQIGSFQVDFLIRISPRNQQPVEVLNRCVQLGQLEAGEWGGTVRSWSVIM